MRKHRMKRYIYTLRIKGSSTLFQKTRGLDMRTIALSVKLNSLK